MDKQCQIDLAGTKYSEHSHHEAKSKTKKQRINSFSEIELQMLENESKFESVTTNFAEVSENTLKTKPEIGARPEKLNVEIPEILAGRKSSTCFSQYQEVEEEPGSRTSGNELSPRAEQEKQSTEILKQRATINASENKREKDSTLRMDLLALVNTKTNSGKSRNSSTENTESEIQENQASKRNNQGMVKSARSAMRMAKQQSKQVLNNLYVEELLDDLILFNLLVEHKLTVEKLEKHKEALIKQKEEEEERKSQEAEKEQNVNEGFVVDYDVLYEDEYKLWIKRMEARASATQRHDGGRVPGTVGRPTLWKGYSF